MTDLSDDEINQLLDCLAEQGIEHLMSKEDMKTLLKKNAKKSKNDLEKNNLVESNIEISKVENTEISKIAKENNIEQEDIENNIKQEEDIENNIEHEDIENNIEQDIENNIKNIREDISKNNKNIENIEKQNLDTNIILKNNVELDSLIESSNNKLKELLNKKNKLKETHDNISENLKNIRKKLDDNYNTILNKQDKLKDQYISKLSNIKENLEESIYTKNSISSPKKNIIIPPLNLDGFNNNTNEYPNFEKYNKLHNKILNYISIRNKFHNYSNSQNKYSPPPAPRVLPQKNLYNSQSGYFTERFAPQSPFLNSRQSTHSPFLNSRPPTQSPYLNSRKPYQSPYYTERKPPQSPYFNNRYPQSYTNLNDKITPRFRDNSFFDGTIYGEKYQNRPSDSRSKLFEEYLKEKKNSDNKYIDFDELCKKYETERDNDHEIIITTTGPPSNAMDIINNALDKFEKEFYYEESKNEKTSLRSIFDKLKNYKKTPLPKYDKDELAYYDSLEEKKKDKIDKLEIKISQINNIKTPLRFRVLQSNLPLYNKSMIINKIEDLFSNKLLGGSEITKYSNWVNSLLKVPFKKYKKLPIDADTSSEEDIGKYLIDVKKTLDTAVYGHTKTKEQVIQIIAQWITNPNCIGNCIGIQGVMGNGKTTLVKNGIAKAIGRPFAFITLGGCSDSSFLEGHNYTYEGSMWGKIVDVLMECKCMNPVFYFDELDKVSETPKGEEIINSLIHLTDSSQNNQYADKYFNGVEFDLSKSLFIFSYNDITKINPILLDRLICIKTDKFELDDKIHIAKNYLLREIYEQLKIKEDTYKIEDDNIKYIIETYTNDEGGVRTLKKHLYNIFSKFNLLNLTKNDDSIKYSFDLEEDVLEKKIITNEIIDTFIKDKTKEGEDEYFKNWYM
tara:strand:- start:48 stop:2753 length:2706 start_codon:yes stop_codon:yes gene_type:complete